MRKVRAGVDAYFFSAGVTCSSFSMPSASYGTELREPKRKEDTDPVSETALPDRGPDPGERRSGKKIGARRRAQRYLELCDKWPKQVCNCKPSAKKWSQGRFGRAV